MENKVRAFFKAQGESLSGQTVTCAVSGGKDSVVLLHLLHKMQGELGIRLSAAHFNHHLRGAESDRDEQFVRQLCAAWRIPLTVGSGDVAKRAEKTGESIEEAARAMRYAFFESLGTFVATAHTAEDNLETVLLNLLRGTGLTGLCGIPPKRGMFLRPLLCVSREEVEAYQRENALPFVEDATNEEDGYRRNRLRHRVLPLLAEENPAIAETFSRTTRLLRADNEYLNELTEAALKKAENEDGSYDCTALSALPEALKGRAVRKILQTIHAPKLTAEHIGAVQALIESDSPSARCDLPGLWRARREYGRLILERCEEDAAFSPVLLNNGLTKIPALGLIVRAVRCAAPESGKDGCIAVKDSGAPLYLRPRQTGDVIRLSGGSKTLKKLFIDKKIPAAKRGLVPVLADEDGVLAVLGVAVDVFRAAKPGEAAWVIEIEKEVANDDRQI